MANSKLGKFLLDNTTTSQTIAKNTFWLSFGEITGRLLRVGLIFYAARVLGAAGYGVFSYMTSLAGILTIFADLGLSGILIREGAKSEELRKTYFATSLFIKLIIVTGSFVVIILVAPLITDIPLSRTLIYAVGLLIVFDSLRGFGNAIFRAEEQMQYEAGTSILTQIIIVAGGIYTLTFTPSPESLAISYATGSAVGLIIVSYLVRKYIRGVFKFFRKDLIV
ncbi:oligosaccharide flippase family protein, partial [Patescibacteria group bacterium]|nr:oligosaccharide flippase family protein [Patescibacteria group bacterium]